MGKAGVVAVKGGGSALKSSMQRSAFPRKREHRPSHGRPRDLLLASGDPIFLAPAGRLHDSRLEERFASEFCRSAPGWNILRAASGASLPFPDFLLPHRLDPSRH